MSETLSHSYYRTSSDAGVVVTEYTLNVNNPPEDLVVLFDLPVDSVVSINETSVPGKVFDYFNPLIVTPNLLSKMEFYHWGRRLDQFTCSRLQCESLERSLAQLIVSDLKVYYPPKYLISYKECTASKSRGGGIQVCDWINHPPHRIDFGRLLTNFFTHVLTDDRMDAEEY